MQKLNELAELAKRAVGGEWHHEHRMRFDPITGQNWYNTEVFTTDGETIATLAWYPKDEGNGVTGTYREDNARFISAANPETILAIAAAFRELEQRTEAAEARVAALESGPKFIAHIKKMSELADAPPVGADMLIANVPSGA